MLFWAPNASYTGCLQTQFVLLAALAPMLPKGVLNDSPPNGSQTPDRCHYLNPIAEAILFQPARDPEHPKQNPSSNPIPENPLPLLHDQPNLRILNPKPEPPSFLKSSRGEVHRIAR